MVSELREDRNVLVKLCFDVEELVKIALQNWIASSTKLSQTSFTRTGIRSVGCWQYCLVGLQARYS